MAMTLAHRWWLIALRGVAAIVFGILTLFYPVSSLIVLVVLFGLYALLDGVINLSFAIRAGRTTARPWPSLVLQGVLGIVAGVLTLIWPGISALVLLLVIAAWAVVTGIMAIVAAIRLRKQIKGEWLLAGSGLLSVAFGVLLFMFPGPGALAVVWWIGVWAIVYGGVLLWLAVRLRSWARSATPRPVPMPRQPVSPPSPA